jgi:hypothetical protein
MTMWDLSKEPAFNDKRESAVLVRQAHAGTVVTAGIKRKYILILYVRTNVLGSSFLYLNYMNII